MPPPWYARDFAHLSVPFSDASTQYDRENDGLTTASATWSSGSQVGDPDPTAGSVRSVHLTASMASNGSDNISFEFSKVDGKLFIAVKFGLPPSGVANTGNIQHRVDQHEPMEKDEDDRATPAANPSPGVGSEEDRREMVRVARGEAARGDAAINEPKNQAVGRAAEIAQRAARKAQRSLWPT